MKKVFFRGAMAAAILCFAGTVAASAQTSTSDDDDPVQSISSGVSDLAKDAAAVPINFPATGALQQTAEEIDRSNNSSSSDSGNSSSGSSESSSSSGNSSSSSDDDDN